MRFKLIQDGWTVQLFACCASSLEQFDSELHQLSIPDDLAIAKAALRLLWRQCQASLPSASRPTQEAEQPPPTQETSWLDPLSTKGCCRSAEHVEEGFPFELPSRIAFR